MKRYDIMVTAHTENRYEIIVTVHTDGFPPETITKFRKFCRGFANWAEEWCEGDTDDPKKDTKFIFGGFIEFKEPFKGIADVESWLDCLVSKTWHKLGSYIPVSIRVKFEDGSMKPYEYAEQQYHLFMGDK